MQIIIIRKMLLFDQEFYNKNGYAHLGKTLTREQLKLMKQECMKTWFDLKEGYDANKNWLKNTLLQNIHHTVSFPTIW